MILLYDYQEESVSLLLETAKKNSIENYQSFQIGTFEMAAAERVENEFDSKFHGEPNPMYNCHGLTFASRRTGIYQDNEIRKILSDEYKEIKSEKDVLIGDVVIYFDEANGITHSAMVILANNTDPNNLPEIKVLSKILKHKEIIHNYNFSPYPGIKKFYRINHEYTILK